MEMSLKGKRFERTSAVTELVQDAEKRRTARNRGHKGAGL